MSKVLVEDTSLTAIGNALREKLGETRQQANKELLGYQDAVRTFYTKNAKQSLNGGYISSTYPESSKSQTFSFPGASKIYLHYSGTCYGSNDLQYLLPNSTTAKTITLSSGYGSASAPGIRELTLDTDTITIKWSTSGSGSQYYHFYMEITALNEDGTAFQEPIYNITYEEVRNEYKPAEMGEVISSSLGPAEDLQILKIYYSSGVSNATLNFSEYVKNYDNIRQIIWCGGGSNTICIFNYTDYLANVKANNAEPVRINKFGKDSSGYAMSATPQYATPDKTTDYHYFKKSEWDAGGDLKLYAHSSGSASSMSYARYSRYIYLVYKKEDAE